jgi:hypothetical protein
MGPTSTSPEYFMVEFKSLLVFLATLGEHKPGLGSFKEKS